MLQYPATVANRPLLRFALENLADGSPLSLACYDAVLPLGIVHNAILRYQDHWSVVSYLWKHPERTSSPISPRSGQQLDWPMLHRQADASYRAHSNNNEFGLDNEKWDRELRQEMLRQRNTRSDEAFLRTLQRNQEWVDLELLLRELTEFGAQPLLLSMPIHGGWYDQCGITYTARRAYYQKLREISARYHTAVVDFADHDADRSFCHDNMGHLSSQWVGVLQPSPRRFFPRRDPTPVRAPRPCARGEQRDRSWSPVPAGSPIPTALRRFPRPVLRDGDWSQGVQDEALNQSSREEKKSHESYRSTLQILCPVERMVRATMGPVRGPDDLLPGNLGGADRTLRSRGLLHTPFHLPEFLGDLAWKSSSASITGAG